MCNKHERLQSTVICVVFVLASSRLKQADVCENLLWACSSTLHCSDDWPHVSGWAMVPACLPPVATRHACYAHLSNTPHFQACMLIAGLGWDVGPPSPWPNRHRAKSQRRQLREVIVLTQVHVGRSSTASYLQQLCMVGMAAGREAPLPKESRVSRENWLARGQTLGWCILEFLAFLLLYRVLTVNISYHWSIYSLFHLLNSS